MSEANQASGDAASRLVYGSAPGRSLPVFIERFAALIEEEQAKLLPDNGLVDLYCDAIRLARQAQALRRG